MSELEPRLTAAIRASDSAASDAAAARERFALTVGIIDRALDGHDYLVADSFGVADIIVGGILTDALARKVIAPAPDGSLNAYLERLAERPGYCVAYRRH
jgi:glutathione S-transferase